MNKHRLSRIGNLYNPAKVDRIQNPDGTFVDVTWAEHLLYEAIVSLIDEVTELKNKVEKLEKQLKDR